MDIKQLQEKSKDLITRLKKLFQYNYFSRFSILVKKPRLFIFITIHILIMWGYGNCTAGAFILAIVFGLVLLNIALSSTLERIVRRLQDVRHVATHTEKERLIDLFDNVLRNVGARSDIEPYIVDTVQINATAIGRNTIAINRGLLATMNDEQLEGIIAHELGHIKNRDTEIHNIITVYTFLYLGIVYIIRFLIAFIEGLFMGSIIGDIFGFIRSLIDGCVNVLYFICTALISSSMRSQEFMADKFANDKGYGQQLKSALYTLYDMEITDKRKFVDQLQASHPKIAFRIEKLEDME